MSNVISKRYLIKPYSVGTDKRSLAMVIPSPIVKALRIDPMDVLLYLWVEGPSNLLVRILRQKELEKEEIQKRIPAEKFPRLDQQEPLKIVKVVD